MEKTTRTSGLQIIAFWPVLLLGGLASTLLPQPAFVGYRWRVELVLAIFLLTSLVVTLLTKSLSLARGLSRAELVLIVTPLALFTLWSGLSCLWAASYRNALHHTLLWGCFTVFYLLVRITLKDKEGRSNCFCIAYLVVFAISLAGIIEYAGMPKPSTGEFKTTYYPYAEAFVTLLPLIIVVALTGKQKNSLMAALTAATFLGMAALTTSTAMFIGGLAGLFIFVLLTWLIHRKFDAPKRWIAIALVLIAVTVGNQFSLSADSASPLAKRFSSGDELSVMSTKLRMLFWQMAAYGV